MNKYIQNTEYYNNMNIEHLGSTTVPNDPSLQIWLNSNDFTSTSPITSFPSRNTAIPNTLTGNNSVTKKSDGIHVGLRSIGGTEGSIDQTGSDKKGGGNVTTSIPYLSTTNYKFSGEETVIMVISLGVDSSLFSNQFKYGGGLIGSDIHNSDLTTSIRSLGIIGGRLRVMYNSPISGGAFQNNYMDGTVMLTPIKNANNLKSFIISFTMSRRYQSITTFINGQPDINIPSATIPTTGITNTFTSFGIGVDYYIKELLVYNSSLSTTKRQQIESYLSTNWTIPLYQAAPPPTTPTNVTVTNLTMSTCTISWSSTGATSYSYTLNNSLPIPITSPTVTFNSLMMLTEYTFIVTAINSSGKSAPVTKIFTTPGGGPAATTIIPLPPTNLVTSNISESGCTVTWSPSIGATSYSYKVNNGTPVLIITTTANLTRLISGTNHTFSVSAVSGIGQSPPISTTFKTLGVPPAIKSDPSISDPNSTSSSGNTIIYIIIGVVVVLGLAYFALNRSSSNDSNDDDDDDEDRSSSRSQKKGGYFNIGE